MTHKSINALLAKHLDAYALSLGAERHGTGWRLKIGGETVEIHGGFRRGQWTYRGETSKDLVAVQAMRDGTTTQAARGPCLMLLAGEGEDVDSLMDADASDAESLTESHGEIPTVRQGQETETEPPEIVGGDELAEPVVPMPTERLPGSIHSPEYEEAEPAENRVEPAPLAFRKEGPTPPPAGRNGSYLPDIHRLLPSDPAAEKALLGAFTLDPTGLRAFLQGRGITKAHFHIPSHAIIFAELAFLADERIPLDLITFTHHLRGAGLLEKAGGPAFVTELFTGAFTTAMAPTHADIIEAKAALRNVIAEATGFANRAYEPQADAAEIVSQFKERIGSIAIAAPKVKLPELESANKWIEEKDLPIEPAQIVQGILHQGSKLIIGGTSKGRKTFALLDLAASVAAGVPWWGQYTVKGRVCYLNFELQRFAIARRIRWIHAAKQIPLNDNFQMMTLRGWTDPIENLSEKLIEYFRSLPPFALIIFDPVYKLLGDRDENKVGDVTQLLNHIEKIGVETGAATAFGHHYSKGNQAAKESIDRMGGSGAFARDPDAILTMTAHEEDDCFTIEPTLRNFAPVAPFVIRWNAPIFEPDRDLDPGMLKQPKRPGSQSGSTTERANDRFANAKKVLFPIFRDEKLKTFAELTMTARMPNGKTVSRGGLSNWLGDLKNAGLIEQVFVPRKGWMMTEKWNPEA